MTFDQFDLFESYTDNTLPDPQRQTLQQRLDSDATLKAELDDYQQFRHSIEAVNLKQQLDRLHTRLDREGMLNVPPPVRLRRLHPQWIAASVVVLVLTGLGLYLATRPTPGERLFLAYYQPEPVARGLTTCGPDLLPGLQAYRAGRFRQALASFGQLSPAQPCVQYYTGLTQLALDNTPAAIAHLNKVGRLSRPHNALAASPDFLVQKADWYLALACLKANRSGEAHQRLTAIAGQTGHPFRAVARKALADFQPE